MSNIQSPVKSQETTSTQTMPDQHQLSSALSPVSSAAKSPIAPSVRSPHPASVRSHQLAVAKTQYLHPKPHHANTQSGTKTTGASKTPPVLKTPTSKPGSRGELPPAPQLMVIKYIIDIDVIKCPVCMDVFKSPRVVTCGHSMCLDCLNSLILYTESNKGKESFPCPVCQKSFKPRDKTVIRQKWAGQFPVNATILRLLRNAAQKNSNDDGTHKAFCEVCLVNNMTRPAICYCNTCLEHQCEVCAKYHDQREDAKEHDVTYFLQKEEGSDASKSDWKSKSGRNVTVDQDGKRVKIADKSDGRGPQSNVVVAQTITAADTVKEKIVTKFGFFNGNAPHDSATSDIRAVAFLTNNKVVLADHANKKIKVFDITHKMRVELITDLSIRADPSNMCRVDENTVAVVTERMGTFHIRLFTIRDKISHSVHRTVEGVPLGIGLIQNTFVCSFLEHATLMKYRVTRAQQRKVGVISQDRSGNDLFHHPGVICCGTFHGAEVIYVADETEYGITVSAIDLHGDKKSTVFFECPFPKPKSPKRSANAVLKSGRKAKTLPVKPSGKEDSSRPLSETIKGPRPLSEKIKSSRPLSETVNPKTVDNTSSGKQPVRASTSVSKETPRERLSASGRHTFRRVDDFGRVQVERRGGREIERPPMPNLRKNELSIEINKLSNAEDGLNETVGKATGRKSTRIDSKAVERAQKKPVGKVLPQQPTEQGGQTSDKTSSGKSESTNNPNSTITSNSTLGTVMFTVPPKLVYRADSIDVDKAGNVYVCMSSINTVHQMSPDGRVKRELLTEKDGIVAPKAICFSPKNDVFLVTCLKSNKVFMFRLK